MSLSHINDFVPDISQNTPEPVKEVRQIPFWTHDPNVIFQYPLEFFPVEQMTMGQKLNAITRLVLFLTLVMFVMTKQIRVLFVTFLTLGSIAYYGHVQKLENFEGGEQETETPAKILVRDANFDTSEVFANPSPSNPFNNALITDYDNAASKKPAPPAYSDETSQQILDEVKGMIAEANPEQPLINNKLFRSLEDDLSFEQSLRPFFSNPSTTIPNDQSAFADFCYGSMISCKEGNPFACARNLARYET